MPFSLTSFGGAQEVTGSCHLLAVAGQKILLDCGMHQGSDAVTRMKKEVFRFDPRQIDAVVLSHAHLDHSGLLPRLIKKGYRGPIYCTAPTRNLLAVMLEDAANIYFRDLEHQNLRRRRKGQRVQKPLYKMEDVLRSLEQCQALGYYQKVQVAEGANLTFHDAGHILGSAVVELNLRNDDHQATLVFSGDLGNEDSVLMRKPDVPVSADLVMMEATYGDRDHRPLADTIEELDELIGVAQQDGGVILMPSFAVGRTQELLFHLGQLYHQGKLEGWHVFLDSPMAIEVTRLYDQWLDTFDEDDQRRLRHQGARTLEDFLPILTLTPDVESSMQLNRLNGGAIIIAGSGMCNGGRIRHHFKHRLWRKDTYVVFAGFQARGTLGRQLVEGADFVRMFGERFVNNAKVYTLGGFSAHAGRSQLLQWAKSFPSQAHFRLVHGEPESLTALAELLEQNEIEVSISEPGVTHEF